MKIDNIFLKIFFLMLILASFPVWASIPSIQTFVGSPKIELVEGKTKVDIVKGKKIDESFTLKTAANQQIKLQLGSDFYLVAFPESTVKIEGFYITKKDYQIRRIIFEEGRFYIKNGSSEATDLNIIYESDFFEWKNSEKANQREFFLEINMTTAQVRFCAGEKGLSARLFDHEIIKTLKYQEGAQFQGVLKNGDLDFDLLLEGRKIPKGEWKEPFTCDFKQILKQMTDLEAQEAAKKKKIEQEKQVVLKKKKIEYDKSLCHEPNGEFNECLWKFENKNCMRYRCDGQGHWSDGQQQTKERSYHCETKPKVSPCDY